MFRDLLDNYRYFKKYSDDIKLLTRYSSGTKKIFPRFVIFGSADYNNLGDHAISYAMRCFVKEYFSHIEILEFSEHEIYQNTKAVLERIMPSDVILLVGGGNLGDQYVDQRIIRNAAIQLFRENPIILFPQSVDYSESMRGALVKRSDYAVFKKHKDFHMFVREPASLDFCKREFSNCSCNLVPDIVLSLNKTILKEDIGGGLLCIRKDRESALSEEDRQKLEDQFGNLEKIDTCLDEDVLPEMRIKALETIWRKIVGAKFVITDRLHAMLFCVLLETPCVVLPNSNKKIEASYEIIKECTYIYLAKNVDEIPLGLKTVRTQAKPDFSHKYDLLVKALQKGLNKNDK